MNDTKLKLLKLALVCLVCIALITGLALVIQHFTQ
jgi:hypothetical protein